MIDKILLFIGFAASVFGLGWVKAKRNEKNKKNKKMLDKIRSTKNRRNSRANDTTNDDLKWLLEHNSD